MEDVLTVLLVVVGALLATVLVLTVVAGVRVWRLRAFLRDPSAPLTAKVAFWGSLLYAASPVDLVPDPIYLDDLAVLLAAATVVTRMVKRHQLGEQSGPGGGSRPARPGRGVRVVPGEVVREGRATAGPQDARSGVQDTPGWRR